MNASQLDDRGSPPRRLWAFVRSYRWGLLLSVASFFLASATEPLIPALLKAVLDAGFVARPSFPLWLVPIALAVLFVARGLFAFCGTYLLSWASSLTVLDMRAALIQAVVRADASLYNHMNPGTAVAKVVNNPKDVTDLLSSALKTVLSDGTTTLAMLAYLFYLDWKLTLLLLVALPVSALLVRLIHRRAKALGSQACESQMRPVSVVDDIARAWRVVRTFGIAASALMSPVSQSVASVGLALILTLALFQAQHDGTTVGTFVGYITALLLLVSRVRRLTDVSQPLIAGMAVATGCFELLDVPEEPDEGTIELENCCGGIQFDRVDVRYPGADAPALRGLSFHT